MKLNQPYIDILPPLSTDEFAALESDVKQNGVLHAIIIDESDNILDGHHRYKCDKNAPTIVKKGLSELEKLAYVLSSNNKRRNLSPEQRAALRKQNIEVAKKLKLVEDKKWTQVEIAKTLGVRRVTVEKWLNESNDKSIKPFKDARVSVPTERKPELVKRVLDGEKITQVAADFGITTQRVGQIVKQATKKAAKRKKQKAKLANPQGKYGLILCDPPWKYDFAETSNREIENQYPTMTVAELCALKPPADDDSLFLLWATAPKLREAFAVIDAWGFEYKTHAIWDKKKIGMGYWFRGQHELLLVATKGSVEPPEQSKRVSSVFSEPRTKHSSKPECVYKWIEKTFKDLSKCEMFARTIRDGWYGWGNEV